MRTIYTNGVVYTGELPFVDAFVVEDGNFVFVGTNEDAIAMAAENDEVIDLKRKFVCAGFNDSHMHLTGYGQARSMADLSVHTDSMGGMIDYMQKFIADTQPAAGSVVRGRGWNQDYFTDVPGVMPTCFDMDKISTEFPIIASRACGHVTVANSKAMEVLGINKDTPEVDGGVIGRFEDGTPNGLFFDGASALLSGGAAAAAPTVEQLKQYILAAMQALNAYGVTSSQTDDCGSGWENVYQAYKELAAEGKATVRVFEQARLAGPDELKDFLAKGHNTGTGDQWFKTGPLKLMADGSLGARSALMSEPYADDPTTSGIPVHNQEFLNEMVEIANDAGMSTATHAIGDGAVDMLLNAVERALKKNPRKDHRHGIVHCQITRQDQLDKLIELDMNIYMQSIFIDYDVTVVRDRVGDAKAETSYKWKYLKDGGLNVSNGTDCPVELPFALGGIQCLVTRQSFHKPEMGPFLPDQKFTVQEAIDSYTKASAHASFEEDIKGQIKPGMYADFVVLDENLFEIDPFTIKDVKVLATYVGGKKVYEG